MMDTRWASIKLYCDVTRLVLCSKDGELMVLDDNINLKLPPEGLWVKTLFKEVYF